MDFTKATADDILEYWAGWQAAKAGKLLVPGKCRNWWTGWSDWHLVSEAIEDRRTLILHIAAACNAERQRGERHHWTYDAARHSQLISLLKTERAELEALEALQ